MSVLIVGMEMPESCQHCFASDDESRFCKAAKEYIPMLGKPKFCPLVPVPPHGRLIDADKEMERVQKLYDNAIEKDPDMGCVNVYEGEIAVLQLAPTIIPASEEGES